MADTLIFDSALRLLRDHADRATFASVERGEWPTTLWKALVEAGFHDMLDTDLASGCVDALQVLRAQGQCAAPAPLLETMLAAALGHPSSAVAPVLAALPRRADIVDTVNAPWPGVTQTLACTANGICVLRVDAAASLPRYTGEPQAAAATRGADWQALPAALPFDTLWLFCALARAAMIRGALEHMLALTVDYANTRVQFGKPLGKQQAVQHQLALMAEEVAAAGVAVDYAIQAFSRGDAALRWQAAASAKIRAGEAAGKAAEIAHQIHGAVGFTQEYELQRYSRRIWFWRDEFGSEAEWACLLGQRLTAAGAPPLWHAITRNIAP